MDWEVALLSKVIYAGDMEPVLTAGIHEGHFLSPDNQLVWRTLSDYFQRHNSTPSTQYVQGYHPAFQLPIVSDPIDVVIQEFVIDAKRRHAMQAVRDLARVVDNPDRTAMLDIEKRFSEIAYDLSLLAPSADVGRFSDMQSRIDEYKRKSELDPERGIPYGIIAIDQLTGGIRPHEFISVIGWQGTGKSTLAQYLSYSAWSNDKRVLYFSMEMSKDDLLGRWDTMSVNFQHKAWRDFELTEEELLNWERMAAKAAEFSAERDIIVIDEGGITVDRVYAEMNKWKPDLVVIDYLTLMALPKGDSMWMSLTLLTQKLKSICQNLKIPIVGIAQTNIEGSKAGAQLDNIAYSRSIGQDSDISLGLHQPRDMRDINQMEVRLLKNRLGATTYTKFYWEPGRMKFGEWTEEGMFQRRPDADEMMSLMPIPENTPPGYAPGEISSEDFEALAELEDMMRKNRSIGL